VTNFKLEEKSVSQISKGISDQVSQAYKEMADNARYRPAAPSDGMGNIIAPEHELNLEQEQAQYVKRWWDEEDAHKFHVGCCDFRTRPAVIFSIEAIRNLNAGVNGTACGLKLLEMAVQQLKRYMAAEEYKQHVRD
jgi:hypothetical protein